MSRKHDEAVTDSATMSEAIGAVTEANVQVAAVVQTLIGPLRQETERLTEQVNAQAVEIERQAIVEERQTTELGIMGSELEKLTARFTSLIRYVNILRRQVYESGHEPHPVPSDIDFKFVDDPEVL